MGININSLETLAKRVSKYTKLCGKDSILMTKSPSLSQFDTTPFKYKYINTNAQQVIDTFEKDKNFVKDFFDGVTKEYSESKGTFRFKKRIIHGKQPTVNEVNHNISDSRLAQPIQLKEHSDYIFDVADLNDINPNFVKQYLYKDSYNQVRQKDHLYLEIIQVQKEHQRKGIASKMLKEIQELSNKRYNGKLTLSACSPPGTEGQIPSPSLAYWSKGFRFTEESVNEQMLKVLKGELPLSEAPCGYMFWDNTIKINK